MINHFLYLNNLLNLYNFLNYFLNLDNSRHLFSNLNKLLNNSWNLDYSLYYVFNWYNFFDCAIVNHRLFKWDIYDFLYLSNFLHFDYFLYYSVNCNNLRYLHNFLHYFLYYFLNLNYFWNNSKYLKYIVNINNSHNLLSNHANYSLIHFRNNS